MDCTLLIDPKSSSLSLLYR